MKLATTTVSTRATMLPAMPMQAMKNAVSRPGRRVSVGGRADSAPAPARCAAMRSMNTDNAAGASSSMPTTAPMPNFICPLTWL